MYTKSLQYTNKEGNGFRHVDRFTIPGLHLNFKSVIWVLVVLDNPFTSTLVQMYTHTHPHTYTHTHPPHTRPPLPQSRDL